MCIYKTEDGLCGLHSTSGIVSYCLESPCADETMEQIKEKGMTLGKAIAVVKSINSPRPTADIQEKLEAIKKITEAATLNSVTKQDLLRIIKWMWKLDAGKLIKEAKHKK